MIRIRVAKQLCDMCLECERPGRMPGLITRQLGDVLVAWPRLDDFDVAAGVVGALDACGRKAITIEVVQCQRDTVSMSNTRDASARAAGSASST